MIERIKISGPMDINGPDKPDRPKISGPMDINGPDKSNRMPTIIERMETIDLDSDIDEYRNKYVNSKGDFELTFDNKKYTVTGNDLKLLQSIVSAEAIDDPDDALAVMSVILNRCENEEYKGNNPISVITAEGQFTTYSGGAYKEYYNGSTEIPNNIKIAVNDGLNGIRNNHFHQFRGAKSQKYSIQVVERGNKFGDER